MNVLVSRFPDHITPGALPILPEVITVHDAEGGAVILRRWFYDGAPDLREEGPEIYPALTDALKVIPAGYGQIDCPREFARLAYRLKA